MRTRVIAGYVGVLVLIGACASPSDPSSSAFTGPHDESAQVRTEFMEVEPASVQPGEGVSVSFPPHFSRGLAFVLEAETAAGWDLRYFLVARSQADGATEWWTPEDAEDHGWEDLEIRGPGPDLVEAPDTAAPGSYRLCTANRVPNVCALLDITA